MALLRIDFKETFQFTLKTYLEKNLYKPPYLMIDYLFLESKHINVNHQAIFYLSTVTSSLRF